LMQKRAEEGDDAFLIAIHGMFLYASRHFDASFGAGRLAHELDHSCWLALGLHGLLYSAEYPEAAEPRGRVLAALEHYTEAGEIIKRGAFNTDGAMAHLSGSDQPKPHMFHGLAMRPIAELMPEHAQKLLTSLEYLERTGYVR